MQLLHWVSENYPDIVCILLTSHADFSYAQESIKLGCFDYVVQPAPYQEIEDALYVQLQKSIQKLKKIILQRWSFLYKSTNRTTDRTILNLFSQNPATASKHCSC